MKCPNCKTEMEVSGGVATCPKCGARYKATEQTREHMTAPPTSTPFEATTSPPKANDLQDIKRRLAAADEVQGLKEQIVAMEEKQSLLERELAKVRMENQSSGAVGIGKSGFTATVFELFTEKLLLIWVSMITLGIAYPWLKCHYESFKASRTYIKGRRLVFNGRGGALAKKYFLWAFLSAITFGIFGIFAVDKIHKWVVEHTHYDGNETAESSYNGKPGVTFLFNLAGTIVGVFTFGLVKTFVICKKEKYYSEHTLINGSPVYFEGTGFGLLKKQVLWGALTVATFGVFGLWKDLQRRQWICSNLSNDYADDVSADSETPEEERARIEEEKRKKEELALQKELKKMERQEAKKKPVWKANNALFTIGTILIIPLIIFLVLSFVWGWIYPETKIFVICLVLCSFVITALMVGSIACSKKTKRKVIMGFSIAILIISTASMCGGFYGASRISAYNTDPYFYIMQEDGTYAISLKYYEESGIEKNGDMYYAKKYKQDSLGENIVIPSSYKGVPVTAIADNGFNVDTFISSKIKSITIPNSVTSIGDSAFSGCTGLSSITIPDSVTSIGKSAFYGCYRLTSVTIGGSVTSIGSSAFSGCTGLTSVTIPDSVTSIGYEAFYGCTGLTSITIPDSVTSIGDYAFSGCTGLTKIIGPSTVASTVAKQCGSKSFEIVITSGTSIGDSAFYECTGLTSITIPDSVTSIGEGAFYNCTGLTSVTIGDGVTSIGNRAFYDCSGLTSITIPDSVTSIGVQAFLLCTGLTNATIGNGVTSIGNYAFDGCYRLVEVYNKSTLSITAGSSDNGKVAYYAKNVYTNEGGSKLSTDENGYVIYTDGDEKILVAYHGTNTELILPLDITKIYQYAFYNCKGLTSVTIPDSVTSIGKEAFSGCTGLTTVNWNATKCTSAGSYNYPIFNGCSNLATVNIGDNVKIIPSYAFLGCTGLTSVTIPDSVTSIGYEAFYGCSGLTSVTIGSGVTSIGNSAFYGCYRLTSVTIGSGVTSIGNYAFDDCYRLIEVYNKSTLSITAGSSDNGKVAYYAKNVYTNEGGSKLSTDENGYVIYTDGDEKILVAYHGTNTELILPLDITKIYQYAFYNCKGLTSVTIPDSVTSIGDYAFRNCTGLKSVTIGNSVTSIGYSAFYECYNLQDIYITDIAAWCNISGLGNLMRYDSSNKNLYINNELASSITIPDSVTSIGSNAFRSCTGLTSVTIPDSVTSIGGYAFYNTAWYNNQPDGLVYAGKVAYKYKGTMPSNTSIVLKEGTLGITAYAFSWCTGLTSITIPDSVTSIGNLAFRDCTGLTSVTIPDSVTSIGDEAFAGCTGLTSITIPDSVTSIGGWAFSGCTGLTSVAIGNGVTSIGSSAFSWCTGLTSITFNGTKAQWKAISKGEDWKYNTGNYVVHCTDGDISKANS